MIWADTNILLRLITRQSVDQYNRVMAFLEITTAPIFVHPAHICEALYVLEGKTYQRTSLEVTKELQAALSNQHFEVIDATAVNNALSAYPASNLDFPDVLICGLARVGGGQVLTFDRKMARLSVPLITP